MTTSTISTKGQITIPVEIRNRLGVKPGDRVEFVTDNGRTELRPARSGENPFLKQIGALPGLATMSEVHDWVSDLRDDDDRRQDLDQR